MRRSCRMRRRISSKSNSCTEGMIVYVAGIGMKAGVPYPGRSVCLPRATLVKRCGDGHTEVSRGHSRSEMFDETEGPNVLSWPVRLRFADMVKRKMSPTDHAVSGCRQRNCPDKPSVRQVSATTSTSTGNSAILLMEQVVEQSNLVSLAQTVGATDWLK